MITRRTLNLSALGGLSGLLLQDVFNASGFAHAASQIAPQTLLAAQIRLVAALLARLDGKGKGGNAPAQLMLSPMSLAAAFAIIAEGADDTLKEAIAKALGFPASTAELSRKDALTHLSGVIQAAEQDKGPLLSAGKLVLDPGVKPNTTLVQALKAKGLDVSIEDLSKPEVISAINAWVKDKTRGLIPTILDEAPGKGGLVALNALYFKDRWASKFEAEATKPLPFTGFGKAPVEVPTMSQSGTFLVRFDVQKQYVGVDLPFVDPRFSLVLVTCQKQPRRASALLADAKGWLGGAGFKKTTAELYLPKLEIETSTDLLSPLNALGLKEGISPNALQLFGEAAPSIRQIAQRCVLKLDEEGAEAAAATAIIATRSLEERPSPPQIRFDKPFLFALRNKTNGLIVLAGYVDLSVKG